MTQHRLRTPFCLIVFLSLAGCGGGGGGGGGGERTQPDNASLSLNRSTVEVGGTERGTDQPTETVVATVSRIPDDGLFIYASGSENGLTNAELVDSGPETIDIELSFRSSAALDAGTYEDTVTVSACYDEGCSRHVIGSPRSITTRYTVQPIEVTDPVDTTVSGRMYFINATDIVWDAASARILIATKPTATQNPNSLIALDPVTRTRTVLRSFNEEIGDLAISEAFEYLYVEMKANRVVRRYLLPSLQFDSLFIRWSANASATDLAVQPGAPLTVAYADHQSETTYSGSLRLTVADDGVSRPNAAFSSGSSSVARNICWNGPAEIWGTERGFYRYDVDGNGVSQAVFKQELQRDVGRVLCGLGLPHSSLGLAFDPETGDIVRDYVAQPGETPFSGTVDPATNRFFLISSMNGSPRLNAFDAADGASQSSVELRNVQTSLPAIRTIRWGDDGIATLSAAGELLVLRGSIISGDTD